MIKEFIKGILIVIDKLANVLLCGSSHQTVSMRLSFAIHCKYVKPKYDWVYKAASFVDWLFTYVEKDHIWHSYEAHEIINKKKWCWYQVTDQVGYDQLKKAMVNSSLFGRKR